MPRYHVTAPDGRSFEVTAPEGASKDQVMSFARSRYGDMSPASAASAPAAPTATQKPGDPSNSLENRAIRAAVGTIPLVGPALQMQTAVPPSVRQAFTAGAGQGIVPELAKGAGRMLSGEPAPPPEPHVPFRQAMTQLGHAAHEHPAETAAAATGAALVDTPLFLLGSMIPGFDEAAGISDAARVARLASKGGIAGGVQSAAQQFGETGRVSGKQTAKDAAVGAAIPGGLSGTKRAVTGPLSAAARTGAKDVLRQHAVQAAEKMGLQLSPEMTSGRRSAKVIQKTVDLGTLPGHFIAKARDEHNAATINRVLNQRAGIASDVADQGALAAKRQATGQALGSAIKAERVVIDPQLVSDAKRLTAEADRLGLGKAQNDVSGQRFANDLRYIAQNAPRGYVPGDVYQRVRQELEEARLSELRGSKPNATNARWYADFKATLDHAFDRGMAAQGRGAQLTQIQKLRQQYEAQSILTEMHTKGHVAGQNYDATGLLKILEARNPNWATRTPGQRNLQTPYWGVAETADTLELRPPEVRKEYVPDVAHAHPTPHGAAYMGMRAAGPYASVALPIVGSFFNPAAAIAGGVGANALPYLWNNIKRAARPAMSPTAPLILGAGAEEAKER